MLCAIWYHLYNFKKSEKHPLNIHGGVFLLVKLQAACNFIKSNSPLWVFFTFLKL